MYITKVVFIGSEGNKTVEIEESTDKKYAKMKYSRALDKWFKILTHLDDDNIVRNMPRPQTLDILVNFDQNNANKLKFIKMYLNYCNGINDTNCSFDIEMHEGSCIIESESEDEVSEDENDSDDDADDEKDDDSEHSETYEEWREKRNERRIEALLFGIIEE
jgi:hypothetical protein